MAWRQVRQARSANRELSNSYTDRGSAEELSAYLFSEDGTPRNFVISGGNDPMERYDPLYPFLEEMIGRHPVIVLHAGDRHAGDHAVEELLYDCCHDIVDSESPPVRVINQANKDFEPFYKMSEMQTVTVCRQLAVRLGYTVTPRFERVVRAHIAILIQLDIPVSLSGFYYLCQFCDMGEFYDNILALPCGETAAKRLWADLGVEDVSENSPFDLFRAVVNNLALDAQQSGWNPDNTVAEVNCITAIEENEVLLMEVNNVYTDLLLTYITSELKSACRQDFVLVVDGVRLGDDSFREYLLARGQGCHFGIVAENVVDLVDGGENVFFKLADKADCLILLKHGTGKSAILLSEVIGRFDAVKAETSKGASYSAFRIFPNGYHHSVGYSTENRYRVMPEELTSLCPGQAVIFETVTDRIIRYN